MSTDISRIRGEMERAKDDWLQANDQLLRLFSTEVMDSQETQDALEAMNSAVQRLNEAYWLYVNAIHGQG